MNDAVIVNDENETHTERVGWTNSALVRVGCTVVSALALGGAGTYLILGSDKGIGIFAVLLAAILCRVLLLNVAEQCA